MQQRASVLLCDVLTLGGSAAPVPVAGGPVPAPRVTGFTLLDATTDQPIPGFDPIANGSVLDLAVLPTRALNIRANVDGVTGSVRFDDGQRVGVRTEDLPPYALAGDDRGDYEAWNPALRERVLMATPFAQTGGRGAAGTAASVTFRVTSGNGAGAHGATRATPSAGPGPAPDVPSTSVGRIAVTADGNQHDKDDWGASPLGLAILAQRGIQANVVHYDYNSHGWDSAEGWAQESRIGVLGAGQRFGFDTALFFDDTDGSQSTAGTLNLTRRSTGRPPVTRCGWSSRVRWRCRGGPSWRPIPIGARSCAA